MLDKALFAIRLLTLGLVVILVTSMFLLSPSAMGPFGLTAWFSGLLVAVTGGLLLGLLRFRYPKTREGFTLALRRSFLISMWAVALLALSSLRQLSIRDIILLTILGLLVDFYMQRVGQ